MNIILFGQESREDLLPLTFTKPVSQLRVGILKIKEKWEHYYKASISCLSNDYLRAKFPVKIEEDNLLINGSILPNKAIINEINKLEPGQLLIKNNVPVAAILKESRIETIDLKKIDDFDVIEAKSDFKQIKHPWDIFKLNGEEIENDFKILTKGKKSKKNT